VEKAQINIGGKKMNFDTILAIVAGVLLGNFILSIINKNKRK